MVRDAGTSADAWQICDTESSSFLHSYYLKNMNLFYSEKDKFALLNQKI